MPTVSVSDVHAAQRRIAAYLRPTPVVPSRWLSEVSGAAVLLKLESLQISSSFKSRGALNAALRLVEERGTGVTVVTASAGNHGRAIAWSAGRRAASSSAAWNQRPASLLTSRRPRADGTSR